RERLGAIVLRDTSLSDPDPQLLRNALMSAVRKRGVSSLPWSGAASRLRARMAFVAAHVDAWPDVSDAALTDRLDEWLAPSVAGARRWSDVERVDLTAAIGTLLDWRQRRELDDLAPTHIEVPSGSRVPIDYSDSG